MNVGITQRVLTFNNVSYDSLSLNWYNYLEGHILTVIPNRLDQDFEHLANNIDLLIISGGDVHPIRQHIEITLTDLLCKLGKPVIGVCHGFRFLTEYFGGTVEPVEQHYDTTHKVIYNKEIKIVNSYHSLKVTNPPDGAKPLVYDLENNCESWIKGNVGGVMWHPERESWLPECFELLLKG